MDPVCASDQTVDEMSAPVCSPHIKGLGNPAGSLHASTSTFPAWHALTDCMCAWFVSLPPIRRQRHSTGTNLGHRLGWWYGSHTSGWSSQKSAAGGC